MGYAFSPITHPTITAELAYNSEYAKGFHHFATISSYDASKLIISCLLLSPLKCVRDKSTFGSRPPLQKEVDERSSGRQGCIHVNAGAQLLNHIFCLPLLENIPAEVGKSHDCLMFLASSGMGKAVEIFNWSNNNSSDGLWKQKKAYIYPLTPHRSLLRSS